MGTLENDPYILTVKRKVSKYISEKERVIMC